MINLTPIAKNIQKRLFEKMKVLGRETSTKPNQSVKGGNRLTHAKMATRSTFLRMTSGATYAVIFMGGELKPDDSMAEGYKDIYGSRAGYDTGLNQENADFNWSIDESLRIGDLLQKEADPMYEGTGFTKSVLYVFFSGKRSVSPDHRLAW